MKIYNLLWLSLVLLLQVSCSSGNKETSGRLQGDVLISEFTKKLSENPKNALDVYKKEWKTNYSNDIMSLLGIEKEEELEKAIKEGHEKIKTLYSSRKGDLELEASIQALTSERSKLIDPLLEKLKKADMPDKRVSELETYLKGLPELDKELLLLNLGTEKLKEKCKEGFEAFKTTLTTFENVELQKNLKNLANKRILLGAQKAEMRKSKPRSFASIFTSYVAIFIYCVLGIFATVGFYFIYIKDFEEEVYV